MWRKLFPLVIVLSSLESFADLPVRQAILFGGNCEDPAKAKNDFLEPMSRLARNLKKKGWEVKPIFGERPKGECELSISDPKCAFWDISSLATAVGKTPKDIPEATSSNMLRMLDEAYDQIPSGGELLFVINTHGSQENLAEGVPHKICTADPAGPGNWEAYKYDINSPDFLQRLRKLKDKGVKITITDDSCYGGGSIIPLSPFGCVLSATGPDIVNTNWVSGRIVKNFNGSVEQDSWSGTGIVDSMIELSEASQDRLATLSLDQFTGAHPLTARGLFLQLLARSPESVNSPQLSTRVDGLGVGAGWGPFLRALDSFTYQITRTTEPRPACSATSFRDDLRELNRQLAKKANYGLCEGRDDKVFAMLKSAFGRMKPGSSDVRLSFPYKDLDEFKTAIRDSDAMFASGVATAQELSVREREVREEIAKFEIPPKYDLIRKFEKEGIRFKTHVSEMALEGYLVQLDSGRVLGLNTPLRPLGPDENNLFPYNRGARDSEFKAVCNELAKRLVLREEAYRGQNSAELATELKAMLIASEDRLYQALGENKRKKIDELEAELKQIQGKLLAVARSELYVRLRSNFAFAQLFDTVCRWTAQPVKAGKTESDPCGDFVLF